MDEPQLRVGLRILLFAKDDAGLQQMAFICGLAGWNDVKFGEVVKELLHEMPADRWDYWMNEPCPCQAHLNN